MEANELLLYGELPVDVLDVSPPPPGSGAFVSPNVFSSGNVPQMIEPTPVPVFFGRACAWPQFSIVPSDAIMNVVS
jgi:hypothetical protein